MFSFMIFAACIFAAFIICNTVYHAQSSYLKLNRVNTVFALTRASGLLVNATLLTATIYKLKTAKVHGSDTGHLNVFDASFLLVFILLMCASGLASKFTPRVLYPTVAIVIDIVRDILDYLLAIMYFKMITNFITTFKLRTKVTSDGSIDIVGYDDDGHEVFKFNLENEQHLNLLGFSREQIKLA